MQSQGQRQLISASPACPAPGAPLCLICSVNSCQMQEPHSQALSITYKVGNHHAQAEVLGNTDQQPKALTFQMGITWEGEGNIEGLGSLSDLSGHPPSLTCPRHLKRSSHQVSANLPASGPQAGTGGLSQSMEEKARKESCWLRLSTPSQNTRTRSNGNFGMFAIHTSTPEHKVHLVHIRLLHTFKQAKPFRMLLAVWGILPTALDTHQVSGFEAFWIRGSKESLT